MIGNRAEASWTLSAQTAAWWDTLIHSQGAAGCSLVASLLILAGMATPKGADTMFFSSGLYLGAMAGKLARRISNPTERTLNDGRNIGTQGTNNALTSLVASPARGSLREAISPGEILVPVDRTLSEDVGATPTPVAPQVVTDESGETRSFIPGTDIELADLKQIAEEVTGFALFGDPGSGKTTFLRYMLQAFEDMLGPCQLLVFDTHDGLLGDGTKKWGDLPVLYEIDAIIEAMQYLLDVELEDRKRAVRKGEKCLPLVWIYDEAFDGQRQIKARAATQKKDASLAQLFPNFLIGMGAQGRKYNVFGGIGNQAGNTGAVGMEGLGDYLESFYKFQVGRVALKRARSMGVDRKVIEFLASQAYPCLADDQALIHPTHGGYVQRKRGQPPANLRPIHSLPLPEALEWIVASQEQFGPESASTPEPMDTHRAAQVVQSVPASPASRNGSRPATATTATLTAAPTVVEVSSDPVAIFRERTLFERLRTGRAAGRSKPELVGEIFAGDQAHYEQLVEHYAPEWVFHLAQQGTSQRAILDLVWGVSPRRNRVRYQARRDQLEQILQSLGIVSTPSAAEEEE